jgi:N-acetyl-anhydromuramyl-L-alanine amidase AmpD
MKEYNFTIDAITTHRAISPGRKNDVDAKAEKAIVARIKAIM